MGVVTKCWSGEDQCRDDEVATTCLGTAQEKNTILLKTPQIHVKRITGFTATFSGVDVTDTERASSSTPQGRGDMSACGGQGCDVDSPFCNNNIGEVFGLLDSPEQRGCGYPRGGMARTISRRRASTSLLSEDLERASSKFRMEVQEKSNFDTQMSKLKCLSICKDVELDGTPDSALSRTLSCRGMPGELRARKIRGKTHDEQRKQSPGTVGSSGSEARPIPHMSRACTAPDQLPELSSSMLESLLLEREKEEKKSPKSATLSTPNGTERRINATGRRVPSAAFLDDLAALQERQYSVFRNNAEKRISTRHHLYST